jgi:archaemetzincin
MNKIIYLLKIGKVNQPIFLDLKKNLEVFFHEFNISIKLIRKRIKLRKKDFDKARGQFRALKILERLVEKAKIKEYFRIFGILDEDIYSKNYDFIFGLATKRSFAAIISITRLRERFYVELSDLSRKLESKEKLNERVLKEAKHEIGHTFGLKHCHNICVMQRSERLVDIDNKQVEYCESCLTKIKNFLS